MQKSINWGIIGCGDVTEVKSGPAFNKAEGSKLVAVMRRNGSLAKDYAQRHGVPFWYDNATELIQNPEVNAIYVATPPGAHAHYAIAAMQAGKPVYVEKPMAASHEECVKMNEVSQQTGVPLFVAYYRRALPGFVKVKALIDSGQIGKPLYFSIRFFQTAQPADFSEAKPWRVVPEISGGGYVFDLGSHQLDFLDWVLGPVEQVVSLPVSRSNLYEAEDFISAGFVCSHGITGNAVWDFAAPEYLREDTIEIAGEKGRILFSCFDFKPIELIQNGRSQFFENSRPDHVQQPLIELIVKALQDKGSCPSTGITAARTSKVLDALVRKIVW